MDDGGAQKPEFGKRKSAAASPAPPAPDRAAIKRSRTVSLVLVAGAGLAAYTLARIDPSQREEDVLVYSDPTECIRAALRDADYCRSGYESARQRYPLVAPRYATTRECEGHHGPGHCLDGGNVTATAVGKVLPRMAGYMIARRPEQDLQPEPVFDHAPRGSSSGSGRGGYSTSSGTQITTSSGGRSSVARVSSSSLRQTSFGGFGETGRSFSSSSRGFFSGG